MSKPDFSDIAFPPQLEQQFDCGWPLGMAAQWIVLKYFGELLEQRAPAWDADEVEAVHKLRVAARRTRTALQTFGALWERQPEAQKHLRSLSDFAEAFNMARDLDVMIIYLREQLERSDNDKRSALTWLLERNEQLREEQRPLLHKTLRRFEKDRTAEKFVSFFSKYPVDLWPQDVGPTESANSVEAAASRPDAELKNTGDVPSPPPGTDGTGDEGGA